MTQLYKLLIVVAAVAVVSIIHAMTTSQQPAINALANATQIVDRLHHQPLANNQINALINTGDSISQTHTVNNIYETNTGTFYLELENLKERGTAYAVAPLLDSQFDVRVTGNVVRTRVTQTFNNQSEHWQNGVYVFPLPEDAGVDAMLMQINERKIEGIIEEKTKAKAAFETAKATGKSASLVSQLRPNMFINNIANIAPRSTIVVTIEYQQVLNIRNSQYQVRIPTSITPRYSPDSIDINMPEAVLSATKHSSLAINMKLNMGGVLSDIISEHHIIRTEAPTDAEQTYRIFLDKQDASTKDFVLTWQLANQTKPTAIHLTQHQGEYQYGLIQIIPPIIDAVAIKRDVTFILDTSGSMVGEAIEQAKAALTTAIDELQANDTFNIIEFNSGAHNLWPSAQSATATNKASAKRFVNKLQASGGTEIAEALSLAFSLNQQMPHERELEKPLQQILFITDGSVSNEAQLLNLIANNLQHQRLFTIGIGSAPNTYFMSEAAIVGRGTFTLIGDISQVNSKMSALLSKIKYPVLSNVQVNLSKDHLASEFEIYPKKIPDIYAGEPITLVYRVTQNNANFEKPDFVLQAQWAVPLKSNSNTANSPVLWQSQLPEKDTDTQSGIAKHWAYYKIQQLTRSLNITDAIGEDFLALQQHTKKSIVNTAMTHKLVSAHTSLIAIDEQQNSPSAEYLAMLAQKQQQIKTLTHKHWSATQMHLPQTSTASALYLLIGILMSSFALMIFVIATRN